MLLNTYIESHDQKMKSAVIHLSFRLVVPFYTQASRALVCTILGCSLVLSAASAATPATSAPTVSKNAGADGSWFLESNAVSLDPGNRFLGSLTATNPGSGPVFIRVTVERLDLANNQRVRSSEVNGALKAFPAQFMLRAGQSFPVRLLVDLSKQGEGSQSFYVKLEDVSNTVAETDETKGMVGAAYLLAYEALVSVHKSPLNKLIPAHFALSRQANGAFGLTNLSGQHVYLNRGDACPDAKTLLVNCTSINGFPRQTMLPNETLVIPAIDAPVLGVLAYPKLNMRSQPSLMYLDVPGGK